MIKKSSKPNIILLIVELCLRRSDESTIIPPLGYTEFYDKDTGLISYQDNVRDITWYTNLDKDGRLYFYTKTGRSEWELPSVPSNFDPKDKEPIQKVCFLTHLNSIF